MYGLKFFWLLALGIDAAKVPPVCPQSFHPISVATAFAGLNPGWNLGNTLDAIPTEGSWNNAPVVPSTFAAIKADGFKSIRLPVTWAYHFDTGSPSWTVNKTWMDRVETVVDEVLAKDMFAVLNVHHDSWVWADITAAGANITMIEEKFSALWTQIATRFRCKSSKLIFEALNEPTGSTAADGAELNKLTGLFLKAVSTSGGHNPQRVVAISGLGMDSYKTASFFEAPVNTTQPWGLEFHYYSPYDFIFDAWGKTIWGSDSDKAQVDLDFGLFRGNFSNIPVFIGEYDSPGESAASWKYYDNFVRLSNKYSYSSMIWDNGASNLFNRSTKSWTDPVVPSIIIKAVDKVSNALADSTTDPNALTQSTSAYLFHKVGDPIVSQNVTYLLNNNTLHAVADSKGKNLPKALYSMSSTGTFTLSAVYLHTLITQSTAPGVLETLTLSFKRGTFLTLTIMQYSLPTVTQSSYSITDVTTDLHIPVSWNSIPQPAAVKAILTDGTFPVDSWTIYLPELQKGRLTFNNNWNWDSTGLIVTASTLNTIQTSGQSSAILTIETFPRNGDKLGSNAVNITLTV